jgi:soluble lytic murein transglycosylase-like protein
MAALLAAGGAVLMQVEAPAYSLQGAVRLQSAFVAATEARSETGTRPAHNHKSLGSLGRVERAIYTAAKKFGVDRDYLRSLAWCESDLEVGAYSPAGYYGLFQFDKETWSDYGHGSIWDPVAQARTAARLLAAGERDRWPNCT